MVVGGRVGLPKAIVRNIEWATEAQPWRPVSLLVALAGTEGQFSPMFMSVGPFACVHFGVFLFGFCFWGCLFFFFFVIKKMCIFLAMTET